MSPVYDPYRPPHHGAQAGYVAYRSLGWKTTLSAVGVVATIMLTMLAGVLPMALSDVGERRLLVLAVIALFGLASTVVSLGTGILFLVWTHQAATNVRAFGQHDLEITPGWAVGWWFVPFASLVMPYKALKEVWCASDPDTVGADGDSWTTRTVPSLFPLWWGMYLIHSLVGSAVAFAQVSTSLRHPQSMDTDAGVVGLGANFFLAIAGVAIISIMKQLGRRQEASARKLSLL